MQTKYKMTWGISLILLLGILLLPKLSLAKPSIPGPPPEGKSWTLVKAHWELVEEPSNGPQEWKTGYWDTKRNIWVEGSWVPVKSKRGYEWVSGHYDPVTKMWITGHWVLKGKAISLKKSKVPAPPPSGKAWVYVPEHYELVNAPPEGPNEWRPGYWDVKLNVWVPGAWITINRSAPRGQVWIAGHWDPISRRWIAGHWGVAPRVIRRPAPVPRRPIGPPPGQIPPP